MTVTTPIADPLPEPPPPSGNARGRLGLLRQPDFAKLWLAETISQFGTQVSLLAVPLVAITILQATAFEVALLGTIEFLPFILFTLPAGTWVDRLRRRPILISGDLVRAVSLATIPIAFVFGILTIWQLYVVGFVNGVATVFFDVSYQSYLPFIVERDELVEGNAKLEISRSAAQVAGPPIAGGLIGVMGAPLAILLDSLSFIGSALFVGRIRRHEPTPDRHVDEHGRARGSLAQETREGLRYVLTNRYLRSIAASTATSNLFGNIAFAILLVYVVRDLGLDAATIGLVFGLGGLGTLAGAFSATRLADSFGVGPTIVGSIFVSGIGSLLVPLAPRDLAIPYLVAFAALGGFGGVVYNVNQVSFRQAITPERMQGRMNATMRFIVWGTIPIGSLVGGALATTIGLRETIWLGAIGSCTPFLFVLFSPVRSLRRIPAPDERQSEPGPAAAEAGGP